MSPPASSGRNECERRYVHIPALAPLYATRTAQRAIPTARIRCVCRVPWLDRPCAPRFILLSPTLVGREKFHSNMTANLTGQDPPSAATQKIPTGSGMELVVEQRCSADRIELLLRATGRKNCILHWGIRNRAQSAWHILPKQLWPEGTQAAGTSSMQTPFKPHNGHSQIAIDLAPDTAPELLEFVLFFPEENRWDNNGHRNYQISIGASVPRALPGDFLKSRATSDEVC